MRVEQRFDKAEYAIKNGLARDSSTKKKLAFTSSASSKRGPSVAAKAVIQVRERTAEVPQVTSREEIVQRSVTEHVKVIKEVAQNETQQVQKQETKPE